MKKALLLAALIAALFLTGCGKTYEDGYAEGYDYGYDYGYEKGYETGLDDAPDAYFAYEEGFEDGFEEGYVDIRGIEDSAVHYARKYSEWHPEEAVWVIDAYRNGECLDEWEDSPPTKEEYEDAINSLYHFYMYFYSGMYE